ncbi:MAG TPA: deoxyribodipyrimidine photo-lyase [Syntrophorhabdaceae bacterium]|nr:deoxyribodipyrimidine photo-lyase [Syntrophorhabdaceae bacterium]
MDRRRVRTIRYGIRNKGPVAYWMNRDQRANDNWALIFAQSLAIEQHLPLCVVFCLSPQFFNTTLRHYDFMLEGLKEVEADLLHKEIPFFLISGTPEKEIPRFISSHRVSSLITDFDPLKIKRDWKERVAREIAIPFFEVDAHNIVPCWVASEKLEYGAYTIRPKIRHLLKDFLTEFPPVQKHPFQWKKKPAKIDLTSIRKGLTVDRSVSPAAWIKPGEKAAHEQLENFIKKRLGRYSRERNDPNCQGQSDLSPYLHFGQISAQRIALEVLKARIGNDEKNAFLEELIIRKELSDNYCFYNNNYDRFEGFPTWAQKTLNDHRNDHRAYIYSLKAFEDAKTHDDLWNAAQVELVKRGKMHGYIRMYWAKKILEWSESPEAALEIAIYLNDRYGLDGMDPNGYTGIAWSIGGVHDRPWRERPIFGKVRYMSYSGCSKKFDVQSYIQRIANL